MVRESYGGIIGDAPIRAIPFGRVATVRGSLRRCAYAAMLEGEYDDDTPEECETGEPNCSGAGASARGAVPGKPERGGHRRGRQQPFRGGVRRPRGAAGARVRRLHGGPVPSGRLAGRVRCGDRGHGVHRRVLDTAVRGAGRARFPGDVGGPPAHQERVRSEDRRAGLPVVAATDCCREPSVPTRTYGVCAATCGNGPCWCSTLPTTSSICRRR